VCGWHFRAGAAGCVGTGDASSRLPFSQPAASGSGAAQISRESERAGAGALGHDETVGEAWHDGAPTTALLPDTAPVGEPIRRGALDTALVETPRRGVGARPPRRFACGGGDNLAGESAFLAQAELAAQATGWYRHYVSLLRRLWVDLGSHPGRRRHLLRARRPGGGDQARGGRGARSGLRGPAEVSGALWGRDVLGG